MNNVQLAENCVNYTAPVFEVTDEEFALMFPAPGQDIEFSDDIYDRLGFTKADQLLRRMYCREIPRRTVPGIHGTLFEQHLRAKPFYPTKKRAEMVRTPLDAWVGARGPGVRGGQGGRPGSKNVQLVTDSVALDLPIFAVMDDEFALLFPGDGQDVEFNADVERRLGPDRARAVFTAIAGRAVPHVEAQGIHGLLFWDRESSRRDFPTKKSSEVLLRVYDDEEYERLFGVQTRSPSDR